MLDIVKEISLSTQQLEAAVRVAEGDKALDIAYSLDVPLGTLHNWMRMPEFREYVQNTREEFYYRVVQEGAAQKANRIKIYNDLINRHIYIIKAREEEAKQNHQYTGDESGLIGERVIPTKGGGVVFEPTYEEGMVRTLQNLLKQIAQEVGDWDDHSSVDIRMLVAQVAQAQGLTPEEQKFVQEQTQQYIKQVAANTPLG